MWNWVNLLEKFQHQNAKGQSLVLVTVTKCAGSTPRNPGAKMIVLPDGSFHGTIGGGRLEQLAIEDALACLSANSTKVISYPLGPKTGQCCGGLVELFMEVINNGPRLYIFGAGHVGQALCRTMVGTPFSVHLIDEREEWIRSERVPSEIIRYSEGWEQFIEDSLWDKQKSYSVVMTHRHDLDQEILEDLMQKDAAYIGLIGSQSKWTRFSQRYKARGMSDESLARVKCPIGIPIGGKSPQEVAISVGAELLRIFHGKPQ